MEDFDPLRSWRKTFRSFPANVQRGLEWMLILVVTIILVFWSREWLRFLLIPLSLVLFLRVADRVPLIGPFWRWLFGDRSLWDWLTLLFIPLALAVIGLQVSSTFNAQRSDSDVEKTRFEAVERYLTNLASPQILPSNNPTQGNPDIRQPPARGEAFKYGCGFAQPRGVTATSLTRALASSLTHLRKSIDKPQIQKKIILDYLYTRGLITRGNNVIDLRYSDMTSGDYYQADLKNSCLNDIMFADSAASLSSASDFRFAHLEKANLAGANLAQANLRKANLEGAILTNSASLYRADLRGANLRGIIYDKATTNFDGAIFNTKTIAADHDRKGWLGFLLCGQSLHIFDVSKLCIDPRDYANLPPTRFPDDFYDRLPDKDGLNGKLSKPKLDQVKYKISLVEMNDLP